MRTLLASTTIAMLLLGGSAAWAGRNCTREVLVSAIASRSRDAITAALEQCEKTAFVASSYYEVVNSLFDDPDAKIAEVAGWAVGKRGLRQLVLEQMSSRLSAQDPIAARNAAYVLAGMRDPAAVNPLGAYLVRPLDEESGRAAAYALGQIGHPAGLSYLNAALASSLAGVRAAAVAAIRNLRSPDGTSPAADPGTLLASLNDQDASVRVDAAYTAGHLGVADGRVVSALIQMVSGDGSATARRAAANALGQLRASAARAALTQALSDSDPNVRSIANRSLKDLR